MSVSTCKLRIYSNRIILVVPSSLLLKIGVLYKDNSAYELLLERASITFLHVLSNDVYYSTNNV